MGIVYIKTPSENSVLGLWQITETHDELFESLNLSSYDSGIYNTKKNDLRKKEWLACRNLIKSMLNKNLEIIYDLNGKPYLADNQYQISISHSGEYACVYLDKFKSIGVDVQQLKPTLEGGKDFFVNETENDWVNCHDNVIMHIIWSVKESVFKYCGINELNIKKDITVYPFESNQNSNIEVNILYQGQNNKTLVSYEVFDNYVLTYTV